MLRLIVVLAFVLSTMSTYALDATYTLEWTPSKARVDGTPFAVTEIHHYNIEWYDVKGVKISSDIIENPTAVSFVKIVPQSYTLGKAMIQVCDNGRLQLCSDFATTTAPIVTKNTFKKPTNLRVE